MKYEIPLKSMLKNIQKSTICNSVKRTVRLGLMGLLCFVYGFTNAQTWEGTYVFDEADNHNAYHYKLIVYDKGLAHTADLTIKGIKSIENYQCKVIVNDQKLQLFLKYLDKEAKKQTLLKEGNLLLSLVRNEDNLETHWNSLKPRIIPNDVKTKVFFDVKPNSIEHYRKYAGFFPYEVGFFNEPWIEENLKKILEGNYDNFLSYLVIEKPIKIQGQYLIIEGSKLGKGNNIKSKGSSMIIIDVLKGKINSAVFTLSGKTTVYKNLDDTDEDVLDRLRK